jgi:uncharacterized protein (TIGR02453 family)
MAARFSGFPEAGVRFLADLERNNDRAWFNANKAVFKTEVEGPAKAFAEALAEALHPVAGRPLAGKLFRMHRDTRFSKDKTPYNAHVRIAIGPAEQLSGMVGDLPRYFFSLEPTRVALGLGVFEFSKAGLEAYRASVHDDVAGEELAGVAARLEGAGYRLGEAVLKRVPAGFDQLHPRASLLRRKGLSLWHEEPVSEAVGSAELLARTLANFSAMQPLSDWISRRVVPRAAAS